jgi:membrane protein YqaA with SNARE-associated domain
MDRRTKIFWVLFFMLVIVLLILVIIHYEIIGFFMKNSIKKYMYPAIFFFSLLSNLFQQPIGSEAPGVIAVLLGANILLVFFISALGISIGLFISYYVGKYFLSDKMQISCSLKKYRNYCKIIHKYGRLGLLLAMLTPIPDIFIIWLVGAFKMKLRDFVFFGVVPAILRTGIIFLLVAGIL